MAAVASMVCETKENGVKIVTILFGPRKPVWQDIHMSQPVTAF